MTDSIKYFTYEQQNEKMFKVKYLFKTLLSFVMLCKFTTDRKKKITGAKLPSKMHWHVSD